MSQRDVVLRWIEQLGLVVARLLHGPGAADLALVEDQVRAAITQILGPLSETIPRLDVASAAGLLHDPERIYGYARLLALLSAIEQAGGEQAFRDTRLRAEAMAREAVQRSPAPPAEWLAWIEELASAGRLRLRRCGTLSAICQGGDWLSDSGKGSAIASVRREHPPGERPVPSLVEVPMRVPSQLHLIAVAALLAAPVAAHAQAAASTPAKAPPPAAAAKTARRRPPPRPRPQAPGPGAGHRRARPSRDS